MPAKTMFGKTKHEYLGDMVSLRNPSSAKGSIRELEREFFSAKTKAKRLRIARAAQLAANRARASAKKQGLARREESEFRLIAKLYETAAEKMFTVYGKMT